MFCFCLFFGYSLDIECAELNLTNALVLPSGIKSKRVKGLLCVTPFQNSVVGGMISKIKNLFTTIIKSKERVFDFIIFPINKNKN